MINVNFLWLKAVVPAPIRPPPRVLLATEGAVARPELVLPFCSELQVKDS